MFFSNFFALGTQPSLIIDLFRQLFFFIDGFVYSLIPAIYNFIFYLYDIKFLFGSEQQLHSIVSNFSNATYSFLAIVMFFRTAVSLITMLVDPSKIDDKEQGARKIVINIFLTLALIVAVPWIFDSAKKLQSKIMEEHIIESLVMGDNFTEAENYTLGNEVALSTWSVFLNVYDDGNKSVVNAYNGVFQSGSSGVWPVAKLFSVLNNTNGLTIGGSNLVIRQIFSTINLVNSSFGAGNHYYISYVWLLSTIAGIYVLWTFIKLLIDVAYRSIKFFILEILSPIAIISYIDPSSGKKGLFSKWSKETLNTYISLFVRLFVFAIATVLLRSFNLSSIGPGNPLYERLGTSLAVKFIYILALVAFLKNAPKFIDDLFGTSISKGSEAKFAHEMFGGILGAGVTAVAGGISGAVAASATGKSAFKGAMSGAWASGKKGYAAGKKGGFGGMVGVVGDTYSAINDQNKKYGYEHDKEMAKRVSDMKRIYPSVNAKKTAEATRLQTDTTDIVNALTAARSKNGHNYSFSVLQNDSVSHGYYIQMSTGNVVDENIEGLSDTYKKLKKKAREDDFVASNAERALAVAKDIKNGYMSMSLDDKKKTLDSFDPAWATRYGTTDIMTAISKFSDEQVKSRTGQSIDVWENISVTLRGDAEKSKGLVKQHLDSADGKKDKDTLAAFETAKGLIGAGV